MLFLSGTEGACEELTTTTSKIMVHLRGYTYISFCRCKDKKPLFFIGHPIKSLNWNPLPSIQFNGIISTFIIL